MRTIRWKDGIVETIDQTVLPEKEEWIRLKTCEQVASALKEMKIRGAPLIGVATAFGMALAAFHSKARSIEEFMREMEGAAETLRKTRPTAVNLFWAIDRIMRVMKETNGEIDFLKKAVIAEAQKMADEDVETNRMIGVHGASLINDGDTILTHCNAGRLATVDYGTALAVVRAAWKEGKRVEVFADETRPMLQGARLTVFELMRDGIPVTLITDNMAGYVLSRGIVNKVIVGADRIVRDGVINKIGTYSVAVLAHENRVPFYVAAPTSTFDPSRKAREVIIEERSSIEVTHIGSVRITPEGVKVINPAFDVTPMKYVTAIICEKEVITKNKLQKYDLI